MRGELVVAKREFSAMMREKSFALVLIFEILLVSSSAFLSSGYSILSSPETSDLLRGSKNVIVVGLVTDSKREFALPLQRAGILYYNYQNLTSAEADFQDGLLDAIVIGSIDLRAEPSVITVYLPSNTPKLGLIKLMLKRFFLDVEERLRQVKMLVHTPAMRFLTYDDSPSGGGAQDFEVFMLFTIPLLFFMPAIMAGSLIIDGLTEEMESGRLLNLLSAPMSYPSVVAGKCLGAFAATIPHCIIWLAVLPLAGRGPANPAGILVAFILYSCLFISVGAAISLHTRRNRPAQMAYTLVSVAAITTLSPSANALHALIMLSPAHMFTAFAAGAGIGEFWWQLLLMAALNAAAAAVAWRMSAGLGRS
jgi:ABC-2 type transport system permease protein